MIETLISFIILLILGSVLVPVFRDLFQKNYSDYLKFAFSIIVLIFFFVRIPEYNLCSVLEGLWTIITFPLRPFGLLLVVIWVAWSEANKGGSVKKIAELLLINLIILSLISAPVSSAWIGRQLGQTDQTLGGNFVDYVPSATGLQATTSVLEKALPTLYRPFNFCGTT